MGFVNLLELNDLLLVFFSLFSLFLFLIRINQRNGYQEASMLWNTKTFQFLFSVFPLPWCIALPKMPQYGPLHMPGGQRQNTEWERLQRHKQTLQVLGRQILPLPRFLSSLHFFQNVIDMLKFKFESLGSLSLSFFALVKMLNLFSFPLYTEPFCPAFVMPSLHNMLASNLLLLLF